MHQPFGGGGGGGGGGDLFWIYFFKFTRPDLFIKYSDSGFILKFSELWECYTVKPKGEIIFKLYFEFITIRCF